MIGPFVKTLLLLLPMVTQAYILSTHSHDKPVLTVVPSLLQKSSPVVAKRTDNGNRVNSLVSKTKKKRGMDKEYPDEYWFDDRIHNLGNRGFLGAVHAALAPISTKLIDITAYHGVDMRLQVRLVNRQLPCIQ
jgi:hypothetical protein